MVLHNGIALEQVERHQTALRGPVASASADATVTPKRDAPETSPCRHDGHSKTTARSPKGNSFDWRRRGNRVPCPALLPAKTASAQLVINSSVGPHRSIASPGRTSQSAHINERIKRLGRQPALTKSRKECAHPLLGVDVFVRADSSNRPEPPRRLALTERRGHTPPCARPSTAEYQPPGIVRRVVELIGLR